ncbi:hypothetical protein C8R45DRAFT_1101218 [Mycena sanguinolenta]|nr:hypothetical protein C8R45DRAFT_1101218 [Mycena sanguinolenta]
MAAAQPSAEFAWRPYTHPSLQPPSPATKARATKARPRATAFTCNVRAPSSLLRRGPLFTSPHHCTGISSILFLTLCPSVAGSILALSTPWSTCLALHRSILAPATKIRSPTTTPRVAPITRCSLGGREACSPTHKWIARAQSEHYINNRIKSFKSWGDALDWWHAQCAAEHTDGCPPFEPPTFSLVPDPVTQLGPAPCTVLAGPGAAPAPFPPMPYNIPPTFPPASSPFSSESTGSRSTSSLFDSDMVSLASSSSSSSASSTSSSVRPVSGTSTSTRRGSPVAAPTPAPSPAPRPNSFFAIPKAEPKSLLLPKAEVTPRPYPRPRITPATHISLTPAGEQFVGVLSEATTPTPPGRRAAPTALATPVANARAAPAPTVLATPVVDAHAAPAVVRTILATPSTGPALAPGPTATGPAYGIWGVAMFYPSHAAAKLGLKDPKIMFSSNAAKLEAWMAGKPFVGED